MGKRVKEISVKFYSRLEIGGDNVKRRGRPEKEDAYDKQYRLRMNSEEEHMLNYLAFNTGLSKAEILRKGLKYLYNMRENGISIN